MNELFAITEARRQPQKHNGTGNRCNQCKHGQGHHCGSKIIWYCWKRKSNRTENGLLKIKARMEGCSLWEPK